MAIDHQQSTSRYCGRIVAWSFLTNHGRVLVCVAHDPGIRLRDIAATVGITERSAFAIVSDLTEAGYVVKRREGRRNRYEVQTDRPLPDALGRPPTVGEILDLLIDTDRRDRRAAATDELEPDGSAPSSRSSATRTRKASGASTPKTSDGSSAASVKDPPPAARSTSTRSARTPAAKTEPGQRRRGVGAA